MIEALKDFFLGERCAATGERGGCCFHPDSEHRGKHGKYGPKSGEWINLWFMACCYCGRRLPMSAFYNRIPM